jgi:hypothetical protein
MQQERLADYPKKFTGVRVFSAESHFFATHSRSPLSGEARA